MRHIPFPYPASARPRTVVTTDPELDDLNSMVRLLTHANEIDLRGLVYAGSKFHTAGDPAADVPAHRWPPAGAVLHVEEAIDAYAQVEDTLRVHDPAFPTAAHLRSLVRMGNIATEGEMDQVTPGSTLIADLLRQIALTDDDAREPDPHGPAGATRPADATRPLFLQAWGGISTIARALRTVTEELGERADWPVLRRRIIDRVVLTAFGEQDSTLQTYIRPQWPGLEHREVATKTWGYMTRTVLDPADLELVGARWTRENISSRGPLGATYRVWGDGRQMADGFDPEDYFWTRGMSTEELSAQGYQVWCPVQEPGAFVSEGDSSNFALLVPNGLSSWVDGTFGGWGGRQAPHPELADTLTSDMRFTLPGMPQPDYPPLVVDRCWPVGDDADDAAAHEGAPSAVAAPSAEYHQARWWRAIQHELAARLAWSVTPRYEEANHAPVVSVAGGPDRESAPEGGLALTVRPGEQVELWASAWDPDGDEVRLRWWAYPEAGRCPCPVAPSIEDDGAGRALVTVPAQAQPGQQLHLVVEGEDDGLPSLTRYQRVVLTVA